MRALASYVRDGRDRVREDFVLNVQVPLLYVGPNSLVWDGDHRQRRCRSRWLRNNLIVPDHAEDRCGLHNRTRSRFQRLCIRFVAIGVLEENTISTAYRSLPVSARVPRKTNARSRIKQVALHATDGNTGCHSTLHYSIERITVHSPVGIRAAGAGNVARKIEVVFRVIAISISSEETDP